MSQKHTERASSSQRSRTNTTPSTRRNAGEQKAIFGNPLHSSLSQLSAANILYLQRTIGNRAVTSLIKSIHAAPEAVQRVAYDRIDGSCIVSDVAEGANQIVMTGKLRRDAVTVDDIDAKLDYHATTVPLSKVDNTAFMANYRTEDVIEITTVTATPLGKRIGYVLAYHLGLAAQAAGVKYIIAKNVTAARGPFYTPLGFRDAMDEPQWANLDNEKTQIETTIRQNVHAPNLDQLMARKQAIVELMANNTIFISTADMIQNGQTGFNAHWRQA
jgi:hypothetical protein